MKNLLLKKLEFVFFGIFVSYILFSQTFEFYLPWDDGLENIVDVSYLNHKPAGKYGNVTVGQDGHFYVGNERIKFLGINFTSYANFPDHISAEKIARRLAKFGINIVRFHFLDNNWGYNIFDPNYPDTRHLRAEALDRLDYFIAKLKENGIYSNINLLVGRDFKPQDGLPDSITQLSWKEKQIPAMFYTPMIELQKEYASQILNRLNPYTSSYYKDEPAIAIIELVNEQGLVQGWLSGTIDKLPTEFAEDLKTKWNNWLIDKYGTHNNLISSGWALSEPLGNEILKNNDFSSGLSYWNFEQHDVARGSITVTNEGPNGKNAVKITIITPGTQDWHIQFNQSNIVVSSTRVYTLTFWAKSNANKSINVNIGQAHSPWQLLGFNKLINLTTYWQFFEYVLTVSDDDTNARVNFSNMCKDIATYWISDVSFKPGGDIGLFPEENLDNKTIRIFKLSEREHRTKVALKSWVKFLFELERNFWVDMYNYLKNTLKTKSLITATAVGLCSTPNLMAELDFVDTHAYWQHPVFPGIDWDPENWYVKNATLLRDTYAGTIAEVSNRRVWYKPFTISEYNHPAPNTYNAEGYIILASYAAFQDLDGIYGYTYCHDQNWNAKKITGFFDLHQHPVQFLTFIPAALIYRRGDISPAKNLVCVRINKEDEVEQALTTYAWRLIDARDKGMHPRTSLLHKTAIVTEGYDFPLNALTTSQVVLPTGNINTSDTEELKWNSWTGEFVVDTPRTKAVVGFVGNKEYLFSDGIIIRPKSTLQNGWSCITMSVLGSTSSLGDFSSLKNKYGKILITATGASGNTNMGWKIYPNTSTSFPPPLDANITVGRQWGDRSIVEGISCEFVLPYNSSNVKVYALDNIGNRKTSVSTVDELGKTKFVISHLYNTLWYEVEVTSSISTTNNPPLTPQTPSGRTNLQVGEVATYTVSAEDPDGDKIKFIFDWGDGTTSQTEFVNSGQQTTGIHSWSSAGTYQLQVKAIDEHGGQSGWSQALTVIVTSGTTITNNPPTTPTILSGPTSGLINTPYSYTVSAEDPDGDKIKFIFDWGDGSGSETQYVDSAEIVVSSHIWTTTGTYTIKVKAVDIKGLASDWSEEIVMVITIPYKSGDYVLTLNEDGVNDKIIFPEGDSKVKIYDIKGKLIKVLNTNEWDGTDKTNRKVKSGIYIYQQLQPDGKKYTGKIIVVR